MRIIGIIMLVSIAILLTLVTNTSPSTISPLGILAVYFTMYTSLLGVMTYLLYFGSRIVAMTVGLFTKKEPVRFSSRSSYLYGSVLAIAPVILIAIQSVSSFDLADVMLVLVFEAMTCFYIWRRS